MKAKNVSPPHLKPLKNSSTGYDLIIQKGAGQAANFSDDTYREAGVKIVDSVEEIWAQADIILKVRPPKPIRNWA